MNLKWEAAGELSDDANTPDVTPRRGGVSVKKDYIGVVKLKAFFSDETSVLLFAAAGSLFALLAAHAFERIGGLVPCPLCLNQREVHWTALALASIGWGFARFRPQFGTLPATLAVLCIVFLFSTGLGLYHAGVEYGFWPGPTTCASYAIDFLDPEALSRSATPCDQVAWDLFGISMAGYNALLSLGLAGLVGLAAHRQFKGHRLALRWGVKS